MQDIYRLGDYRRNSRDYSVDQRRSGKSCSDRLKERLLESRILKRKVILMLCLDEFESENCRK